MSALKQNPFVAGFAVVMVLGVGALGYLTYSAADEHSAAREEYEQEASELNRLQRLQPFPNDEHLKKFQAQRQELQTKVDSLQAALASLKIPLEDISPTGFQDKLRDTVARVLAQAPEANVQLPDNFYMGMRTYQGEPPKGAAAQPLYRELRAIEEVINLMLTVKNIKLTELEREPLKEEQPPAPPPAGNRKGPRDQEEEGRKLVEKNTFTIKFTTTQENFQRILNGIVTHKEQFFIPRYLVVANEKVDAPQKIAFVPQPVVPDGVLADNSAAQVPADPAAATAPADAAPAAPAPEAPKLEYIFGKELVNVTMEIDIVDVKAPATKAEEAKPEAKK